MKHQESGQPDDCHPHIEAEKAAGNAVPVSMPCRKHGMSDATFLQ